MNSQSGTKGRATKKKKQQTTDESSTAPSNSRSRSGAHHQGESEIMHQRAISLPSVPAPLVRRRSCLPPPPPPNLREHAAKCKLGGHASRRRRPRELEMQSSRVVCPARFSSRARARESAAERRLLGSKDELADVACLYLFFAWDSIRSRETRGNFGPDKLTLVVRIRRGSVS